MSHPVHPRLPRGEAFRFTPFITDESSVTEWVTPGLPRMLPVVQDDSLCMPIITWNSLNPPPPPPPPPQTIFPHPQAQIQDPSQTLEKSSDRPRNLLKCLYKCLFRVMHTVVVAI